MFFLLLSFVHTLETRKKTIYGSELCRPQLCAKCSVMTVHGEFRDSRIRRFCKFILSRSRCCPMPFISFMA